MMGGKLLAEAMKHGTENQFTTETVLYYMGHSVLLGVILGLITFAKLSMLKKKRSVLGEPMSELDQMINLISDCSTIVFLCVGLSGVMILVNNNLARAFAVAAGIALVRMRINVNKEHSGTNLLFGVISGIACGLGELNVAWASTFIYLLLQSALLTAVAVVSWTYRKKEEEKRSEMVGAITQKS